MAPGAGLEPALNALTVRLLATWIPRNNLVRMARFELALACSRNRWVTTTRHPENRIVKEIELSKNWYRRADEWLPRRRADLSLHLALAKLSGARLKPHAG